MAAAILPILSAAGPLIGGISGLFGGNRAARNISTGNINAERGILGATANAQQDIQAATGNYAPYVGAGNTGISALTNYVGSNPQFNFDPNKYFNSPAYKFQLGEGTRAIENAASVGGFGGNTLRDLTTFGQGLASTYYNQAFNQAQQQFQTNQNTTLANLEALIRAGEFGTSGTFAGNLAQGQLGMTGAEQAGQYAVGAAGGQAGGALNAGNQYSSILSGIAPLLASIPGLRGGGGYPGGIDPNTGLPSAQTP